MKLYMKSIDANGIETKVDILTSPVFSVCPDCGAEHEITDFFWEQVTEFAAEPVDFGGGVCCPKCSDFHAAARAICKQHGIEAEKAEEVYSSLLKQLNGDHEKAVAAIAEGVNNA